MQDVVHVLALGLFGYRNRHTDERRSGDRALQDAKLLIGSYPLFLDSCATRCLFVLTT